MTDLDTRLVKCPDNCTLVKSKAKTKVPKEFLFYNGHKGVRNYCCRCGKKLEYVDKDDKK